MNFLNSKMVKNAWWLISGKLAQMVLSLVVGMISARYLGPTNYGLISYGTALTSFFMSFCTLGINTIIIREFVKNPDEQGTALGTAILYRIISSLCSIVLIVCVSFVLDYGEWDTIVVVLLCSISLLFHAFDTINYWFQNQYKSKVVASVSFIAYAAMSMYKSVLLILGKNVFWFAFSTSIDYIVISILLILAYKKNNGPPFKVSFSKGKELLSKSYHYILSGMMVAIYGQTDKLMLKQMLGKESVGYYATAVAICSMWTFVLSAIIDSMYPAIIQSFDVDKSSFNKKNRQLYAIIFYVSVSVSLVFTIFGELIVSLLYGKVYLPAVWPLRMITWYTAFSYLGVARNAWIVCNHKQKYLKYMYFSACIINFILNLVMIPIMGTVGAAFASLITQIFTSIILPLFINELRPNAKLILEGIMLKDVI